MRNPLTIFAITLFVLNCYSQKTNPSTDKSQDELAINQSIKDWDKAWETKNLEMALKHYSNDIDWTNAFGDRVQSKGELKKLLGFIFNMDFVMAGENNYGTNEITFLSDDIATVRSLNIRKNQKWSDGSKMEDRRISHLRIYQKINGAWVITDHMISQSWPKNPR
ncbi:YybH family protein [Flagellimonas sp. 2504JD4-2]